MNTKDTHTKLNEYKFKMYIITQSFQTLTRAEKCQ